MHIADVKIPSTWTRFDSFTSVDPKGIYTLVNSSPDRIYAVESNGEPKDDVIGVPIEPNTYAVYEKGAQDLYLKNAFPPMTGKNAIEKISNLTINKVD